MMNSPIDKEFLIAFKEKTERFWKKSPISGFQSPRGAKWNDGLSDLEIERYEAILGVHFPNDFRLLLSFMNGTFYPAGTPDPFDMINRGRASFIYAFPRDLELVQQCIQELEMDNPFDEILAELRVAGFEQNDQPQFAPIFMHTYVLCGSDPKQSPVLSIVGTDVMLFAHNLREYLEKEFLPKDQRA